MKKFLTSEVKIALVTICGVAILFFGMNFLKGLTIFSSDDNYYARFNDVSGLSSSSPVYANGYKVGVVEAIQFDYNQPDRIVAVLGLDNQLSLPRGTVAEISSDFLGNVKLELKFGPNPLDLLVLGDTIDGCLQSGLMSKAAELMPQIDRMLPKLDSILASVNGLLSDPSLSSTLHSAERIADNLNTTTQELNKLMTNVNGHMPSITSKVDSVLSNAEQLTAQLSQLDLQGTMQRVDQVLENLQHLSEKLNSKEGSVGLLMNDPGLYKNLTSTMRAADSLLQDIKQHPSRYINVSVFGRKSK